MNKMYFLPALLLTVLLIISCNKEKENNNDSYTYYLVGFDSDNTNWRDTGFIVRTKNQQLIQQANAQLSLPVSERQIVFGNLVPGDGGFNKNASHSFKWHFNETDWSLVDITAEIYDGKPFTDVDTDINYWLNTMKRFGAWSSYIKKKLPGKPQ